MYRVGSEGVKNRAGSTPGIGISGGLYVEGGGIRDPGSSAPAKFLEVDFEPFPGLVETRDA